MNEQKMFKAGDIVTRDGTDRHRIMEIDDHFGNMLVECIKEPLGWLNEDGTRGEPWCKIGDQEWNLVRRYSYPDNLIIEGTANEQYHLPRPEGE